jgi:predicted small secreted protein
MTIYNSNLKMVMKKTNLFVMGLLAMSAVSLSSCSTDNDVTGAGTQTQTTSGTSYMSVKIVTPSATTSRAEDHGEYDNGTTAESEIQKIRFYLFDADGNAYVLTGGNSFVDVDRSAFTQTATEQPDAQTVERYTDAIVVMNGQTNTTPSKVVAIANPDNAIPSTIGATPSLTQLTTCVSGYTPTENNFVMSTSVYVKDNAVVNYTSVDGYVSTDKDNVKSVTIYIERVNAKVSVSSELQNVNDTEEDVLGSDVYVKVNSWGIAKAASQSYLVKNLSTSYTDYTGWNWAEAYRSFWAETKPGTLNNISYVGADKNFNKDAVYPMENTVEGSTSQVLVNATLCDKDGNPMTVIKLGGNYFKSDEDVKKQICTNLKNLGYKKTTTEDFTVSDITIGTTKDTSIKSYEVVASVSEAVKDGEDATVKANSELLKMPIKYWNDGDTYYFTDINHRILDKDDLKGLVRNHSYVVTLKSIKGLGTPVYDPKSTIEPPTKVDDDPSTYMSAEVKCLAWRVVKNSVDLNGESVKKN